MARGFEISKAVSFTILSKTSHAHEIIKLGIGTQPKSDRLLGNYFFARCIGAGDMEDGLWRMRGLSDFTLWLLISIIQSILMPW